VSLKLAWLRHVTYFIFRLPTHFLGMAEARVVKFCTQVRHATIYYLDEKLSLEWAWSRSCDVFKFWEISDNISETVQDRDSYNERLIGIMYGLSNGMIANDLE